MKFNKQVKTVEQNTLANIYQKVVMDIYLLQGFDSESAYQLATKDAYKEIVC